MAHIKNPGIVGGKTAVNSTLTIAVSTSSPAEVKEYINAVLADMQELQNGKFFALRRDNWEEGTNDRLVMFNINNGVIETDTAIKISMAGNLSARSFSTTSSLVAVAGDTFEFIKVANG